MDYFEFIRTFEPRLKKLKFPDGCTVAKAGINFTSQYVWTVDWVLILADKKYLRIREHYGKIAGLYESTRRSFSYHYGPMVAAQPDGSPRWESSDPVDIRIDEKLETPAHLHFRAPEPHIQQESVRGLVLKSIDMFTFIKAVLKHRETGLPLDRALGFTIEVP